jgi:signal transduction protein with GAF and PtsI domain
VLTRVVEAAVFITGAEEGALLLLDAETDELYLRAQRGLGEQYANGYRVPVQDSIAGDVLRTGQSQRLVGKDDGLKVVTGYMVNSIVYVPVCGANGVMGVLSVDNQVTDATFGGDDEEFLMILAGYAALALENARRIEELRLQSETVAEQRDRARSTLAQDTEPATIVVYRPPQPALLGMPPSDRLLDLIQPYLSAVAEIQHCIDELKDKPASKVRILATTHDSPATATIEGVQEAAFAIREVISPQRGRLDELADHLLLAEKEVGAERARLEVLEARARVAGDAGGNGWSMPDFADRIAHLERLQKERESLRQELQTNKIQLACDLISRIAPPLSCSDTIYYVIRLLPALDQVLAIPLQLATPSGKQS